MKQLIALLVAVIAIVGLWASSGLAQSSGAAPATDVARPKRAVVIKSLDPIKGRFHRMHANRLKMNCASCHGAGEPDVLFLRRNDVVPAAMPGQVNRKICLTCHKAPAKPTWYGRSVK